MEGWRHMVGDCLVVLVLWTGDGVTALQNWAWSEVSAFSTSSAVGCIVNNMELFPIQYFSMIKNIELGTLTVTPYPESVTLKIYNTCIWYDIYKSNEAITSTPASWALSGYPELLMTINLIVLCHKSAQELQTNWPLGAWAQCPRTLHTGADRTHGRFICNADTKDMQILLISCLYGRKSKRSESHNWTGCRKPLIAAYGCFRFNCHVKAV